MNSASPPGAGSSAAPTLSVVVSTYNRAGLLAGALHSLCMQTLDPADYEVVIVDNNCTDHTHAVASHYCATYPNVRYCSEQEQGLSHARNRGWREASGRFVGYFDDDAKAPSHWLETALSLIRRQRPDIFGGPYYSFYSSTRPAWFRHRYGSSDRGTRARLLRDDEFLYGTNIFFRRELLARLGGFDPALGMSGDRMGYGEETAMLITARQQAPDLRVYYDPHLYVFHLVAPQKLHLRWLARQQFVGGRYAYRVFGRKVLRNTLGEKVRLTRSLFRLGREFGRDLTLGSLRRDRNAYPYAQNYLYEQTVPRLYRLGEVYEEFVATLRQNGNA